MAYTGKRPGNVNTDFLEAGGDLANHDEVTVDASGNVTVSGTAKVTTGTSGGTAHAAADDFIVEGGSANTGITILNTGSNNGRLVFGDEASNLAGQINYNHGNDSMTLVANSTDGLKVDSSGRVTMPAQPAFSGTRTLGDVSSGTFVCNSVAFFSPTAFSNISAARLLFSAV